jgi:hypothetical protein
VGGHRQNYILPVPDINILIYNDNEFGLHQLRWYGQVSEA